MNLLRSASQSKILNDKADATRFAKLASVSVAGEGQVPGAAEEFARILERKYGLTHEESALWLVHEEADQEHGGGAVKIVARLARADEEQRRVREVVWKTLELLWRFLTDWKRARWSI